VAGASLTVDSLITQIPEGLRDVIGKRLSRLSEECNRVLSVGAVMGRDFSLDVLRAVAGVPEEQLLGAIEEAMGVSLLEEHTQGRDVRYRFTHAYFRQTLYGEMIAPRRLRLHNEVAKALERHYGARLDEHAAELAEHFATRRQKRTWARPCTTASWPRSAPPASTRTAKQRGCWSRHCRCRKCSTRTTTRSASICSWRSRRRCSRREMPNA
jgi:hypothetical protein